MPTCVFKLNEKKFSLTKLLRNTPQEKKRQETKNSNQMRYERLSTSGNPNIGWKILKSQTIPSGLDSSGATCPMSNEATKTQWKVLNR
jgi:hypothetical protein